MNLVDNPYALKSGEAQLALDVDISLRNVLASRKGFTSAGLMGVVASQTKSPNKVTTVTGESLGLGKPIGTVRSWTNPENAKTANAAYATATEPPETTYQTQHAYAQEYGFSLPAGAIPVGIMVRVKRRAGLASVSPTLYIWDNHLGIIVGGSYSGEGRGAFGSPSDAWPTINSYREYGGNEDLWGIGSLSKAQVEAKAFGVGLSAFISHANAHIYPGWGDPNVDHLEMTVYYLTEGFGEDVADHMRPWYAGTKRRLMISANGKVKVVDSGAITTLFTGTAEKTWCFEQMEYNSGGFKDSLWMMNGTDAAKKWDGTTFANWAGKPPKGTMLRVWKNMMIVSGVAAFPQRVFFSDVGNPESPEDETNGGYANRWIDIKTSEDDLDPVVWMEVLDDVLLIFKKRSVNAVYDPSTFSFQRIANVGCGGRFQSCVLDSRAYFVNRTGVYSVTAQGSLRYESLNVEPLFKGTGPPGKEAIDLEKLESHGRMCALPNGRVYLACPLYSLLPNYWLLECYPRLRGAVSEDRTPWVLHSFEKRLIRSLCTYRSKDSEVDKVVAGLVFWTTGTAPELVYLFESTRDGVEPIKWQWRSGFKGLITEEPFERVRRVNLLMKGKVQAKMLGGSVDDTFTLESTEEELQSFEPNSRGRYHALDLSDSSQVHTYVYKGEFALRGGKEHK